MSKTKPFEIPEIKNLVGFRSSEQDRQNLRLLMADRRVTSVSDILRWCVQQQAEPVRQRMQAAISRIAREEEEKETDG